MFSYICILCIVQLPTGFIVVSQAVDQGPIFIVDLVKLSLVMRAPGRRFNGLISKTFVCTIFLQKNHKNKQYCNCNMTKIKFTKQKFLRLKICTCQYKDSMTVYKCDNNNPDGKEKTVQHGLEMWTASVGRLGRGIVGNYCYDCVCMHV